MLPMPTHNSAFGRFGSDAELVPRRETATGGNSLGELRCSRRRREAGFGKTGLPARRGDDVDVLLCERRQLVPLRAVDEILLHQR